MRLADAARFFDRTPCADAFTPFTAFLGQLDVFDDSKRDGATIARRILSVGPSVSMPASNVITIDNAQWIVGTHQDDTFLGSVLRRKYVLHRASGAATIKTIGEALSTGGTATYGAKLWVKDAKEIEISSNLEGFFNIYLPAGTTIAAGKIIDVAGRLHLVRNYFTTVAGFINAESSELAADAVIAATYHAVTYTASTDVEALASTAVSLLRIRFQDDYSYTSESAPKLEPGDLKGYVRKAIIVTAAAGAKVTIGSTVYRVMSVADEGDAWGLHLRHAAA
jgi:hypothetical protein